MTRGAKAVLEPPAIMLGSRWHHRDRPRHRLEAASILAGVAIAVLSCSTDGPVTRERAGTAAARLPSPPRAHTPPYALRWNFSKKSTRRYVYSERLDINSPSTREWNAGDGSMDIVSNGRATADLMIHDLVVWPSGSTRKSGQNQPTWTFSGIQEDGSLNEGGDPGMRADTSPMSLLVLLPHRPLSVGESEEVPVSIPLWGRTITLGGTAKVTLTGIVSTHGRRCAALRTELDTTVSQVPGYNEIRLRVTSTLYFDLAERALVNGKIDVSYNSSQITTGTDYHFSTHQTITVEPMVGSRP